MDEQQLEKLEAELNAIPEEWRENYLSLHVVPFPHTDGNGNSHEELTVVVVRSTERHCREWNDTVPVSGRDPDGIKAGVRKYYEDWEAVEEAELRSDLRCQLEKALAMEPGTLPEAALEEAIAAEEECLYEGASHAAIVAAAKALGDVQ